MKPKDKHTLSYYVTSFFKNYLPGQKNLSPNTIWAYADAFKLLLVYCEEEKKIKSDRLKLENIDRDLISGFLDWLEDFGPMAFINSAEEILSVYMDSLEGASTP